MDTRVFLDFKSSFLTNLSKGSQDSLNSLLIGSASRSAFSYKHQMELEKQNPNLEFFELIDLTAESLKNINKPEYLKLKGSLDLKPHDGEFFEALDESHENSYDVVFNSGFRIILKEPVVDPKSSLPSPYYHRGYKNEAIDLDGVDYLIHERTVSLLTWANLLNEKGYLVLAGSQHYAGRMPDNYIDPISEKILNSRGFYINAILQEVPNYEMRGDRKFETILVISRNEMNGLIFVADLSTKVDHASNFFEDINSNDQEQNLTYGYFINREDFYTLEQLRNTDRAEKTIFFNYAGYKEVLFKDLVGINEKDDSETFDAVTMFMDDITDDSEHDDMRLLAFLSEPHKTHQLDTKQLVICIDHNDDMMKVKRRYDYIFFIVDKPNHARYLEIFFESELGRQIYQSNLKIRDRSARLSTEEIYNLRILMPEKEELLENTVKAYEKLNELNRSIGKLKENFFQNPKKSISKDINLLDDMLLAAGELNEEDEILALIRREEGPDIEFKQTYRLPVIPEGKTLEDSEFTNKSNLISAGVIKVINSFINTDGGTLLIGVQDSNHSITGLEGELQHFFGEEYPEMPKQRDVFKEFFKARLENAFEKNFVDNNINSKFVNIEDKWIFKVDCKASEEPCFLKESMKLKSYIKGLFFCRTGSESRPIKDQEMAKYLAEHFYSKDMENKT